MQSSPNAGGRDVGLQSASGRVTIQLSSGATFDLSPESRASLGWFRGKCDGVLHEPVLSAILEGYYASSDESFFDVGALYGYFGLLVAAASSGAAPSHMFEMNPESYDGLARNISINEGRYRALYGINAALGDTVARGVPTYYASYHVAVKESEGTMTSMDFLTVDDYAASGSITPGVIKIDVEGYEGRVLTGASETLAKGRTSVLLELHSNKLLGRVGTSRTEVLEMLLGAGLQVFYLGSHRVADQRPLELLERSVDGLPSWARWGAGDLFLACPPARRERWQSVLRLSGSFA